MDRNENLGYILRTLIDERYGYSALEIPPSLEERQRMMRGLLNVREPRPVSAEFLAAQNEELRLQLQDKGTVSVAETESVSANGRLRLWQGDITRLKVDAIVNAANSALLGCFSPLHGCIDNAIHSAAGVQLRLDCDALMRSQGYAEPTGQAKITPGYNLPSRFVLHTVGPIVRGDRAMPFQERELAGCYTSCLSLADENSLESIAFCCISTGVFGFPRQRAAEISVSTVRFYLAENRGTSIKVVIFNVFKDEDYAIYEKLLYEGD